MYKETIQDLLVPDKVNIPIVEDAKTGEVLLPGASVVRIHDLDHFMELLKCGETNRHAANTKLNINSSRSHAILMVRSAIAVSFSYIISVLPICTLLTLICFRSLLRGLLLGMRQLISLLMKELLVLMLTLIWTSK